eukprot:scaffold133351_cov72-Phaeocystis_antarctica.AAC.1
MRRAAERARPIDRHAARRVDRGYRGLAPLRWRREERRPAEQLAASSWIPRARGEPPGPRHARRAHCSYRKRSECVSDRFTLMIETVPRRSAQWRVWARREWASTTINVHKVSYHRGKCKI